MQLLSYATHYWSKGSIKSLFLEHEASLFSNSFYKIIITIKTNIIGLLWRNWLFKKFYNKR